MKSQRRQVGSTSGLRLPQVEPMRLYRQIASLISDRIDEGVFPVGSLLPAECDLAERLGGYGYHVMELPLSEFQRGGGSAKSLALRLSDMSVTHGKVSAL